MRTNTLPIGGSSRASLSRMKGMRGFGLVEVMVVICIVGVLAGIAIAAMSGVYSKSVATKSKRQAQNIAATYAAAKAAGATFTVATREGVVDALSSTTGVRGSGVYADCIFVVPMSLEEKNEVRASPVLVEATDDDGALLLLFKP